MLVQQKLRALELKKKHAARMAKAARRREAINARTAHLRSEVRAAQERGEAVAARPAKPMSLRADVAPADRLKPNVSFVAQVESRSLRPAAPRSSW